MGGKSLVLLGLLAGGLYTYFCINTHKDQLYAKLYPSSTIPIGEDKVVASNNLSEVGVASENSVDLGAEKVVAALEDANGDKGTKKELQENEKVLQQLEASTQKKVAIAKDNASFYFVNESPYTFDARLAKNEAESNMIKEINQFCQAKDCNNNIQFLDSVKDESWSKDALNIVHYLADNDVKKGSLSIKDGVLKVTGELENERSKEGMQNLLNAFSSMIDIKDIKNQTTIAKKAIVPKDNASFYFVNKSPYTFNARLAENKSNREMVKEINQFCKAKDCNNDIQFLDSVKEEIWSKDALNIVHYLVDNDVKKGSLSIKDGVLKVTGELENERSKEGMQNLLNAFSSMIDIEDIKNQTTITKVEEVNEPIQVAKIEEVNEPIALAKTEEVNEPIAMTKTEEVNEPIALAKTEEVNEPIVLANTQDIDVLPNSNFREEVTPEIVTVRDISVEDKIRQAQSEINILLQNAVINFKVNSSQILPASRDILDQVISIVNKLDISVDVDVLGHTDASGSRRYNKKLSQRRANSVKKYLIRSGMNVSKITAIGHGEENLIFSPYDKRNRRVEIYLTKGE